MWTHCGVVYWRIYSSLSLDVLLLEQTCRWSINFNWLTDFIFLPWIKSLYIFLFYVSRFWFLSLLWFVVPHRKLRGYCTGIVRNCLDTFYMYCSTWNGVSIKVMLCDVMLCYAMLWISYYTPHIVMDLITYPTPVSVKPCWSKGHSGDTVFRITYMTWLGQNNFNFLSWSIEGISLNSLCNMSSIIKRLSLWTTVMSLFCILQ